MNLRLYVEDALLRGWSPEQIAGRMKREEDRPFYSCHETIYSYIYRSNRRQGRRQLHRYLTHGKQGRTARSHRRHRPGNFLYITPISQRPKPINQRSCFGNWEVVTVQFLPSLSGISAYGTEFGC
jgi:IS30 family transposase